MLPAGGGGYSIIGNTMTLHVVILSSNLSISIVKINYSDNITRYRSDCMITKFKLRRIQKFRI